MLPQAFHSESKKHNWVAIVVITFLLLAAVIGAVIFLYIRRRRGVSSDLLKPISLKTASPVSTNLCFLSNTTAYAILGPRVADQKSFFLQNSICFQFWTLFSVKQLCPCFSADNFSQHAEFEAKTNHIKPTTAFCNVINFDIYSYLASSTSIANWSEVVERVRTIH